MILFPAIDIRGGKCVRLSEGRFDRETIFSDSPVDMARRWQSEGAEYLHVVDLDGARAGFPSNLDTVKSIVAAVDMPVQLGGGIRTLQTINEVLEAGVQRVILGSIAVRDPELVKQACVRFGDRVVVGIDARGTEVAVEGWEISGQITISDLAAKMVAAGVGRFIYTDISRDGMLTGINVTDTVKLALSTTAKVIASGGVKDASDIEALLSLGEGVVEGVIIGKALYTGSANLPELLAMVREKR